MKTVKRSLVTGGCGFIGSHLALELEQLGHEVVLLDNLHSGSKQNILDLKAKTIEADLSKPFELSGRFDFIFHQAAITDPRYGNDEELLEKNLKGFENIIARAVKDGAKLIYASTAGLYGNGPTPMEEDQPKHIQTAYGRSKLLMDERAATLSEKMPIIGLRYFNVYGPREGAKGRAASMVYHLWTQMRKGQPPRLFKWGEQRRDFIFVKDIVRANLCAMEGKSGIYNVGTGVASTFNDLVEALNNAMKLSFKAEYFDMPYDPATYQSNTQADIRKAERDLGFKAVWSLRDGVRCSVDWLESVALQNSKK